MFDLVDYLGLPPDISTHGAELDYMTGLVHWLMIILFVIWAPFFIYTLIRFRQKRNPVASYHGVKSKVSSYLEVGVVLAEVVLLFGFAFPQWAMIKNDFPPEDEALVVHVVAEQFAWNVHYPGPDGIFGQRDIHLIDTQLNPLGLNNDDPYAEDDVWAVNELHFPVNTPVIVHLSSKDVIHSFGVPVLRVKQDAIPGIVIPIWFEATETGEHEIACAQLCGSNHFRMKGDIIVESQAEFDAWLQEMAEF